MIQTKATSPQALAMESEQAIQLLNIISEQLKQQRRHFDDAVVVHCIRLIKDYVDERGGAHATDNAPDSDGRTDTDEQP